MYRDRMRPPLLASVAAALVTIGLLGGCLPDRDDDQPSSTRPSAAQPSPTERLALADLGISQWPRANAAAIAPPPAVPDGVTEQEYARVVGALRVWAVQAATAPDTVGDGLPSQLAGAIDRATRDQTAPGLARGDVLDPALERLDTRMTTAWQVERTDAGTVIQLQSRTAHEVRSPAGLVRVIGVLRTQGVVLDPDSDDWGTAMGWQEFGAADCAAALDDFLTPGGDADDQESDLAVFVEIGNGDEVVTPALEDADRVDDDFREQCEAGRA